MAAIIRVLGELTDELRRSLDFYLSQSENLEVAQILLAGPGGAWTTLSFQTTAELANYSGRSGGRLSLEVDERKLPQATTGLGLSSA